MRHYIKTYVYFNDLCGGTCLGELISEEEFPTATICSPNAIGFTVRFRVVAENGHPSKGPNPNGEYGVHGIKGRNSYIKFQAGNDKDALLASLCFD